jgi:DNA-binding winged helix-turn-helix (wHTH) protein/tetratricopeptide (TPR) repeat protein
MHRTDAASSFCLWVLSLRCPMKTLSSPAICRFGPFILDVRSGDLTRNGRLIRLQEKPRHVLLALAEQPGQIVSRAELQQRLWQQDTFVDFEEGLNTAMRKLRETLGDDPQSPRYIETVRGRGYRFVAPLDPVVEPPLATPTLLLVPDPQSALTTAVPPTAQATRHWTWAAALAVIVALGCAAFWITHGRSVLSFGPHEPVLITSFDNQTGDPRMDHALDTALTVGLEQSRYALVFPRLQVGEVLRLMRRNPDQPLTAAVGREVCQRANIHGLIVPSITRTGQEYLVSAELIDPSTGSVVRSYSERAHGEDLILSALDVISLKLRRDLGESQYQIHLNHQPLPQVTTASLTALEDYATGIDLWQKGESGKAAQLYQAAITADPDFAMAHAALGSAYDSFQFNQITLGEQEFRKALALSSRTSDRERSIIAIQYAEGQGRVEDTLQLQRIYLDRYPDDLSVRYGYARMLRMHGHPQESVAIYKQILQQPYNSPGAYIELALAYSQLDQLTESIQTYQKAFSLEPSLLTRITINREYGFTLVRAGEDAQAEQLFTAGLSDPQTYTNAQRSLAFLDLYRGQYVQARKRLLLALDRTTDAFSQARIRYMLAVVAAGEGDRPQGIQQLDRIMANFDAIDQKVPYGTFVGQAYARAGEVAKATNVLSRITPLVNERVEDQVAYVHVLRAEISAAAGDFDDALQLINPPGPNDSNSSAQVTRESLANIYQKMGKHREAIQWYRAVLDRYPLGWEPQQQIFDADFALAADLRERGDRAAALYFVDQLRDHWKAADPDLPLLKQAQQAHNELSAISSPVSK